MFSSQVPHCCCPEMSRRCAHTQTLAHGHARWHLTASQRRALPWAQAPGGRARGGGCPRQAGRPPAPPSASAGPQQCLRPTSPFTSALRMTVSSSSEPSCLEVMYGEQVPVGTMVCKLGPQDKGRRVTAAPSQDASPPSPGSPTLRARRHHSTRAVQSGEASQGFAASRAGGMDTQNPGLGSPGRASTWSSLSGSLPARSSA